MYGVSSFLSWDLHLEALAERERVGMGLLAEERSHVSTASKGQPAQVLASLPLSCFGVLMSLGAKRFVIDGGWALAGLC